MKSLLLQIDVLSDTLKQVSESNENHCRGKNLSILELITSGGTGGNLIMITLAISQLFLSIYLLNVTTPLSALKQKQDSVFFNSIKNYVQDKDLKTAKTLCKNTDSSVARMLEKGIDRIDKPMTDISASIENHVNWKYIN